jgi:hypothetical protein
MHISCIRQKVKMSIPNSYFCGPFIAFRGGEVSPMPHKIKSQRRHPKETFDLIEYCIIRILLIVLLLLGAWDLVSHSVIKSSVAGLF